MAAPDKAVADGVVILTNELDGWSSVFRLQASESFSVSVFFFLQIMYTYVKIAFISRAQRIHAVQNWIRDSVAFDYFFRF